MSTSTRLVLSGIFLLLSMVFVWRSFYAMRIPVETTSHARG
jgi:hypothetical protein